MTQHTPAPWTIHRNIGKKSEIGIVANAAPCIICTMSNAKEWPQEAEDNARLIAAAPDLLEALRYLTIAVSQIRTAHSEADWLKRMPKSYPALLLSLDVANEVIRKATEE